MTAPQDWTALISDIRRAQAARATYRDKAASPQVRDAAVIDYSRALDAVFDRLDAMMESGLLTKVTALLSRRRWF
jgi:hypothetical protein